MDLSNLSSELPPTKSLEQVSPLELSKELTGEFKNAAKSVASLYNLGSDSKKSQSEFSNAAKAVATLYRLGSNASGLLLHKGYLECLDDLLGAITNGDDIENWALTKRAELLNYYNNKDKPVASLSSPPESASDHETAHELSLPTEYDFSLSPELALSLHFRPGFAPLSVSSYKRPKSRRRDHGRLRQSQTPTHDSGPSTDNDSESSESNDDVEQKKRRALQSLHEHVKKRKMDPPSDND